MTPEEKREYAKEWYNKNKDIIKDRAKKRYHKKMESEGKETTYYQKKRKENPVAIRKDFIKNLKAKYKGFNFEYNDIKKGHIFIVEVKNPFRIMNKYYDMNLCDTKAYNKLQNELKRRIQTIDKHKSIIIVEPSYTQVFLTNTDNIEIICDIVNEFIKDNIAIYGQYKKNGKKMGAAFIN